jgi:hypothetical protein
MTALSRPSSDAFPAIQAGHAAEDGGYYTVAILEQTIRHSGSASQDDTHSWAVSNPDKIKQPVRDTDWLS